MCGGGRQSVYIGHPEKDIERRRLLAPEDKLFTGQNGQKSAEEVQDFPAKAHRRPLASPEDKIPLPLVAPQDRIPRSFGRVIGNMYDSASKPDPSGLSVRYYRNGDQPKDCAGIKYDMAAIDPALDYQFSGASATGKQLGWPGKNKGAPPVFWAKWSGTVNILLGGNYSMNLDIGWETTSEFKVDGKVLKTPGQCEAGKSKASCEKNGCAWDPKETPPCGMVKPAALLQVPGAPRKASEAFLQAHGPAPAGAAPAAPPAPPAPQVTHVPPKLELKAGGHCVSATVLVHSQSKTIRLMYSGPDTADNLIAVPSAVLYCDPEIKACVAPALAECATACSNGQPVEANAVAPEGAAATSTQMGVA